MPVMFKNVKGRALKEYRDRDEKSEITCARTFKAYKECVINNYITIRLEQLEHLYEEYTWEHQKHPEAFYDYEWVIRTYVKGIDEFFNDVYNIKKYDDSIIRIKFLPWKRGEYGWVWDETLDASIESTFNDLCTKLKKWSADNYALKDINLDLAYSLLYKLVKTGDKNAKELLDKQKREKLLNEDIVVYKGEKMYSSEAQTLSEIDQFIEQYRTIDNYGNFDPDFVFEFKTENFRIIELKFKETSELPESIKNLKYLKVLKLDQNNLRSIPKWIGDLRNLEYLSLDDNYFLKSLPDSIGKLGSLRYLSLNGNSRFEPRNLPNYFEGNERKWDAQKIVEYYKNKLEGSTEKIQFKEISIDVIDGYLDLSGLGITDMGEIKGLETLTTLKKLNLSTGFHGSKSSEIDRSKRNNIIIKDIPTLTNLESLIIKDNNLITMDGIERFANLTELDLSNNYLTEIKGIEKLKKLEILNLGFRNKIHEIINLENLVNLKELRISGDFSELKGLESLYNLKDVSILGEGFHFHRDGEAQEYVDYCKMKKDLGVSNLSWEEYYRRKGRKDFVVVHGKIRFINKGSLVLHDKEIKSFDEIRGISELPQLTHFELKDSKISEIKSLETHTGLEWLDLSNNQIEEIKGLESNINLKRLHLEKNNITELKGLSNLSELTQLDLNHNKIADIKGLKSLSNLGYLDLGYNNISKIRSLESLTNLWDLTLNNNKISEIKGLENLTNLGSLDLDNNSISEIKGLQNLENLISFSIKKNPIFREFDEELKSRSIYLHDYAKTAVEYCRVKKEFNLENLTIKDYFTLKDKFENIHEADPQEIKKIYDDLTEIITVKCVLCNKTFKIRKDSPHTNSLEHQDNLKSAYEKLKEPQDPQNQNIHDFKKLSKAYLEERIKSGWGVSFHSITKALLIPENDVQETILIQIQMLKDLLKYKEKSIPSKSICDNISSHLDEFQYFIESLDNENLDKLNNLMLNLKKIIYLFYNQRSYDEERSLENVRYCIIHFWDFFKELWKGIIFKEYSTDIQSHIKAISEFFEIAYIFTYRNTSQFVFDSIEDFNARPWDFDPSEYKEDYFESSIKGRYEKYYRIGKKHYYFWFNSNSWYGMDSWYYPLEKEIKKEFKFKNKITQDPYFFELSCPQCKHINIPISYPKSKYQYKKDSCFKCGLTLFISGYLKEETKEEILVITKIGKKEYGKWIPRSALLRKYSQSKDKDQIFIVDFTQSKDFRYLD